MPWIAVHGFESQSPKLEVLNDVNLQDEDRQHQPAQSTADKSKDVDLGVFLLGRCEFGNERFNAGLMILQIETHGVGFCHRIGNCVWLISHSSKDGVHSSLKPLLDGGKDGWHHLEGFFG